MTKLYVHHKVANYEAWRKVFDEATMTRTRYGSTGQEVFRAPSDPNDITILTTWHSAEGARAYGQSPELRDAMQRGGVISQPDIAFLEEV